MLFTDMETTANSKKVLLSTFAGMLSEESAHVIEQHIRRMRIAFNKNLSERRRLLRMKMQ